MAKEERVCYETASRLSRSGPDHPGWIVEGSPSMGALCRKTPGVKRARSHQHGRRIKHTPPRGCVKSLGRQRWSAEGTGQQARALRTARAPRWGRRAGPGVQEDILAAWDFVDRLGPKAAGVYISAASVFALSISTRVPACVMFIILLSVDEAIWSPRGCQGRRRLAGARGWRRAGDGGPPGRRRGRPRPRRPRARPSTRRAPGGSSAQIWNMPHCLRRTCSIKTKPLH